MTVGKPDTLTFRWLTGILVSIVLALMALWARDLSAQVAALSSAMRDQNVATAEIRGQLGEVVGRLRRIEDNQDADAMIRRPR